MRKIVKSLLLIAAAGSLSVSSASAATALSLGTNSGSGAPPAPNQCQLNGTNFYLKTGTSLGVSQYKIATHSTISCPGPVAIYANEQLKNFISGNPLDAGASNIYVCGSFCDLGVQTTNSYSAAYTYDWHIGYEMRITDPDHYFWDPGPYKNCTVVDPVEAHCDVTVEFISVPNQAYMTN